MTSNFEQQYPFTLPNYDWAGRVPIGQSSYSTVYRVKVLNSKEDQYVAVKRFMLPKTYLAYEIFVEELEKLKSIKSQFIVQYIDSQIYEEGGYLVLELCECDLGSYLMKYEWKMPESVSETILNHIVEALSILRKQGFYSVYLNPQNFLMKKGLCKLNPIGLGKYQVDLRETSISSLPLYMAPEVILCGDLNKSENNSKAEIWSLGVIAYQLAVGSLPFNYQSWDTYRTNIHTEVISIEGKPYLSERMKDFISKCLVKDKKDRGSWEVVSHHPIVQKHKHRIPKRLYPQMKQIWKGIQKCRVKSEADIKSMLESEINQLKTLSLTKFKEAAKKHTQILGEAEINEIFKEYNISNNQELSPEEMETIFKLFRIEEENQYLIMKELAESIKELNIDIYKISENFDFNKNQSIDYDEFKHLIQSILPKSTISMIDKVWKHLRSVHHGVISTDDMLQSLLRYLPEQQQDQKTRAEQAYDKLILSLLGHKKQIKNLFKFFDTNKNDRLNFREFVCLYNSLIGFQRVEEIKIVFNMINKSRTGNLTLVEFRDTVRGLDDSSSFA